MGQQMLDVYKKAEEAGGIKAKIRLALLTQISSTSAKDLPDSPDSLKKFQEALKQVLNEFK